MQLMDHMGVSFSTSSTDIRKSDELNRWWHEWHSYKRYYVSMILFMEKYLKYIQWSTLLPILGDKPTALVGPFTFTAIDSTNRVRQTVPYEH